MSFGPGLGFAARLACLYAAIFTMSGFQLPFFPVWLRAKGLDPGEIGVVLAVPMLVRVLAIPVATRTADKREALREAIMIASCLSVAGYLTLALADGFTQILVAFALASLALTPVMPLAESYALRGLAARGRAYGTVRLWGSAAFVGGTFLAGIASDVMPAVFLIWPIIAGAMLLALSAFMLVPLDTGARSGERSPARRPVLRDPAFIAAAAAASLIQASHASYYGFSALAWRAQGLDGTTIATLWALGVAAEIVLFALASRLPPFFDSSVLLLFGALGGALRWTAMALDPPAVVLPLLQVLHAFSFGATHLGTMGFMARHVASGQSATAQGYLAIIMGAVMAVATGFAGVLYQAFASTSYAAMALAAIAGGVCALIARRRARVSTV